MSFETLHKFLTDCTTKEKIPGCVCWIGNDKDTLFFHEYGYAQIVPEKIRMSRDTIFDLASITKPVGTAMAIMQLTERKKIKLDDKIKKFLPDFKNKPNGEKTIHELLTHTSGIPAWFPIYILSEEKRMDYLAKTNTGKSKVIYSCLGYIILGKIVEVVSGYSLDKYCTTYIFKKNGVKTTRFGNITKKNIAATEFGNKHEKNMASKYGKVSKIKWRDYVIKGEVHDGNAFYSYKGISGNAGLFSNARDLAKIMRHYLDKEIVKPGTLKMMIKDHTGAKEKRGLGWIIDPYPELLAHTTFYHTGFTGTMCLAEPKSNLIIILLTNAIHPKVRLGIMPEIRRKVVSIIAKILKSRG
jgi:CubicO group peptidase (beta-lactamase class C family)